MHSTENLGLQLIVEGSVNISAAVACGCVVLQRAGLTQAWMLRAAALYAFVRGLFNDFLSVIRDPAGSSQCIAADQLRLLRILMDLPLCIIDSDKSTAALHAYICVALCVWIRAVGG